MALKYTQAKYEAPKYKSQYSGQLGNALNAVTDFSYDPLQDASYQALAKVYNANGRTAANDTMGQAAALNGGYGSSYATTAAAAARNSYNQQLAALVPDLEQNAYSRANNTLSALQNAENQNYNRYRDNVADAQWKYGQQNANNQWYYSEKIRQKEANRAYKLDKYIAQNNVRQQDEALKESKRQAAKANTYEYSGGNYPYGYNVDNYYGSASKKASKEEARKKVAKTLNKLYKNWK